MRWKTVPLYQPDAVSPRKLRTFSGAQSGSILILTIPSVVFMVTVLRISSTEAFRNGSTFFLSIVTFRIRTGFSVRPFEST
jgi:hypothetical protein